MPTQQLGALSVIVLRQSDNLIVVVLPSLVEIEVDEVTRNLRIVHGCVDGGAKNVTNYWISSAFQFRSVSSKMDSRTCFEGEMSELIIAGT